MAKREEAKAKWQKRESGTSREGMGGNSLENLLGHGREFEFSSQCNGSHWRIVCRMT